MNLLKVTPASWVYIPFPFYNEPWKPSDEIEGWESLIWTERYQAPGEFELKTSKNIEAMMSMLPLMSFVTLQDSLEVMYVETHAISKDPDGPTTLTVTGRTIESFLENRTTAIPGNSNQAIIVLGAVNTLSVIDTLWNSEINAKDGAPFIDTDLVYYLSTDTSASYTPTARSRQMPRGNTYEEIFKLLQEDNLGIRNFRCRPFKGYSLWPDGLGDYGSIVYNGSDLRSRVIFDVRAGHFENTKYLWSVKGYKNAVYVASPNGGLEVTAAGTSAFTDFDRRVYNLDATDITTAAGATLNSQLAARGRADLATHGKTTLFEGDVSPQNPYKYGFHFRPDVTIVMSGTTYPVGDRTSPYYQGGDYYLGDLVKVIGEYGVRQDMYVTEYVRIEDETGERGYPTLSLPSEI